MLLSLYLPPYPHRFAVVPLFFLFRANHFRLIHHDVVYLSELALMGSKRGSSNLNSGNLVISTPPPPPNCLAMRSSSDFSSRSVSGVASTRPPFLQKIKTASVIDFKFKIITCTYFDLVLYSRIFSRNNCWMGSLTFWAAGTHTANPRRAETARAPNKRVLVSICGELKKQTSSG